MILTKAVRTQSEIAKRMDDKKGDFFPWASEVLLGHLDFDHAQPFLRDETTREDWVTAIDTDGAEFELDPRDELVSYLGFAWEKANGERGISANRSILKLTEWLWLMGPEFDGLRADFAEADYAPYGKPQLEVVTKALAPDHEMINKEGESDA